MRALIGAVLLAVRTVCRIGTLAAFAVLVGVVVIQVLGRVPGVPTVPWTEEVARFALVYLVGFSCGLAVLRGEMVNVDLFVSPLPPRARWVADRLSDLLVLGFSLVILPGAWDYVAFSAGERARSLNVPMMPVYAVMLLIPVSLAFFSVMRLLGFGQQGSPAHGETV
ncbi:MAG TPA: TRAP transporter small permease [Roseomonas sp.]|nr:TRAP transporter small permease [Roseomonas sp.]